jgi:hypothetical protein
MVGDGFRVLGYFDRLSFAELKLSPFLLLDYHPPFAYAPTDEARGVGAHPHRGFETVTVAWEGSVRHRDSVGNADVIRAGDVQWMTAASGILHEERHDPAFAKVGGNMHMAQLWVNLPKAHKMDPPRYQALSSEQIPAVPILGGTVRVIAGEYGSVRGPALTHTPIGLYDVRLSAGASFDLRLPAHWNVSVLLAEGDAIVQGHTTAREHDLVVFERGGEAAHFEAESALHLLVMAGEPIEEPIARYGPFVMNTQREIQEAIVDFSSGLMGTLDEEV